MQTGRHDGREKCLPDFLSIFSAPLVDSRSRASPAPALRRLGIRLRNERSTAGLVGTAWLWALAVQFSLTAARHRRHKKLPKEKKKKKRKAKLPKEQRKERKEAV